MKNKNILLRLLSLATVLALVAAMALSLVACEGEKSPADGNAGGKAVIEVTVIHGDGSEKIFRIETAEGATLRSALESIDLVQGDDDKYGLYVKTVDGERADYDLDGAYWSFSQNGEYMMGGVDSVKVKDGDKFGIAYTK